MKRRPFLTMAAGAVVAGRVVAEPTPIVAGLPPLPYPAGALEPSIDAKTMEIHHGKHHAAYVKGLAAAVEQAPDLKSKSLEECLADLSSVPEAVRTAVRNHGGGHWNHARFWTWMAPKGTGGEPSAALAGALRVAFGSVDGFKEALSKAGMARFGSGWAWLVRKSDGSLVVTSTANQDNPLMRGVVPDAEFGVPLLGVDVWEHAYYLHYQNRRADYLAAWWDVVNWSAVNDAFAK